MAMRERDMDQQQPQQHQQQWFTKEFEQHRGRLRGVAYRMLGSLSEAEDAVQETWLRLSGGDRSEVQNLGGWLTTVISRVCLDMLRARKGRREESADAEPLEDSSHTGRSGHVAPTIDPEQEAMMADAVGVALLVVLDALSPAERIAFVLHDLFGVPFDDIASIVQRTPEATRQLASRARRRVRREPNVSGAELTAHRELVTRFLAALRAGDVEGLVALLDPDLVVHVDGAAAASGKPVELRGARTWATTAVIFAAKMTQAEIALVNGTVGVVLAPGGRLSRVLSITIDHGRVSRLDVIADPARLEQVQVSAFAR
jgi:RNA polymerase sigma factor (sigma-70 family)